MNGSRVTWIRAEGVFKMPQPLLERAPSERAKEDDMSNLRFSCTVVKMSDMPQKYINQFCVTQTSIAP